MEKAEYLTPQLWTFFLLPTLSFFASIVLLFLNEWYPALVCFIVCIIFMLPLIIWRKWFFMQILINEDGLKTFYKDYIFSEIKWNEIKDAKVTTITYYDAYISFSKLPNIFVNTKMAIKDKSIINVRLNSKPGNVLIKYYKKIPIEIRDFEKLPKFIKEMFQ